MSAVKRAPKEAESIKGVTVVSYRDGLESDTTLVVSNDHEWKSIQYNPPGQVWHIFSADSKKIMTIPNAQVYKVTTEFSRPVETPHNPTENREQRRGRRHQH